MEDHDLKQILSGLISVVQGISSLRTHSSSAHGQGKKTYKLEPRHARLAVHSSHIIALFILETWDKKKHEINSYI
ncbi:abortive infection family protein [Commensalibacter nepenthis]|uniref:abortive infection family protein n=1 Tax=Commensalibacter nepenthis TaxID=3043872 RepID=UPI0038D15B26